MRYPKQFYPVQIKSQQLIPNKNAPTLRLFQETSYVVYADDLKVFNTSENFEDLQNSLNKLKEWSDTWNMTISIETLQTTGDQI